MQGGRELENESLMMHKINMSHPNSKSNDNKKLRTFYTQKDARKQRKGVDGKGQKEGPGRELNPGPPPDDVEALRRNHTTRPPGRYLRVPTKAL